MFQPRTIKDMLGRVGSDLFCCSRMGAAVFTAACSYLHPSEPVTIIHTMIIK